MKQKLLLMLSLCFVAVTSTWAVNQLNQETLLCRHGSSWNQTNVTSPIFNEDTGVFEGTYFDVTPDYDNDSDVNGDGIIAKGGITISSKDNTNLDNIVIIAHYEAGYVEDILIEVSSGDVAVKRADGATYIVVTGINANTLTFTHKESTHPHFDEFQMNYYLPLNTEEDLKEIVTNHSGDVNVYHTRQFKQNVLATICLPFKIETFTSGSIYSMFGIEHNEETDEWVSLFFEDNPDYYHNNLTKEGKPYLFLPTETAEVTFVGKMTVEQQGVTPTPNEAQAKGWNMRGTYSNISFADMNYDYNIYGFVSAYNGTEEVDFTDEIVDAGEFVLASGNAYWPAFRAYLDDQNVPQYVSDQTGPSARREAPRTTSVKVRLVKKDATTTGVSSLESVVSDDSWYDLQGRRIVGEPAKAGIYVKNGSKKLVK